MRTKEQILKDRAIIIEKRDKFAKEVTTLINDLNSKRKPENEVLERLDEINKEMEILVEEIMELALEADFISKNKFDIIS